MGQFTLGHADITLDLVLKHLIDDEFVSDPL